MGLPELLHTPVQQTDPPACVCVLRIWAGAGAHALVAGDPRVVEVLPVARVAAEQQHDVPGAHDLEQHGERVSDAI